MVINSSSAPTQPATLSGLLDGKVVVLEVLQGHAVINFGTQAGTMLDLHAIAGSIQCIPATPLTASA